MPNVQYRSDIDILHLTRPGTKEQRRCLTDEFWNAEAQRRNPKKKEWQAIYEAPGQRMSSMRNLHNMNHQHHAIMMKLWHLWEPGILPMLESRRVVLILMRTKI